MIKSIVKDVLFLKRKSEPATRSDQTVGADLIDTLEAHKDHCVGMAANMIGVSKRIIIARIGPFPIVMYNPVLLYTEGPYETEEGCLSLEGTRKTTRYQTIEVEYYDRNWKPQKRKFSGFLAQIIQHEMDHLEGIII